MSIPDFREFPNCDALSGWLEDNHAAGTQAKAGNSHAMAGKSRLGNVGKTPPEGNASLDVWRDSSPRSFFQESR
jgi:hypothetical protein